MNATMAMWFSISSDTIIHMFSVRCHSMLGDEKIRPRDIKYINITEFKQYINNKSHSDSNNVHHGWNGGLWDT